MVRLILRAAAATAALAILASCSTAPDFDAVTPDDATAEAQARLNAVTSALLTADPTGVRGPSNPEITLDGCSNSPSEATYTVLAVDHITLPISQHRAAVNATAAELEQDGFTVYSRDDPDDSLRAGVDLDGPDGYATRIASTLDGTALAILITSPCWRTPDGSYPRYPSTG